MRLVCFCTIGLEDICIDEIKAISTIEKLESYPGIIIFDFLGDNALKLLFSLFDSCE